MSWDNGTDKSVDRRLNQIQAHIGGPGSDYMENVAAGPEQPAVIMRTRPPITTHVLDVSLGKPGSGIEVTLAWWKETTSTSILTSKERDNGKWSTLGTSVTDEDGRSGPLMPLSNTIPAGRYRLTFDTESYFLRVHSKKGESSKVFYPFVSVVFQVSPSQATEHFHVPVLLSPFSYSTYRGS